MNSQAVNEELAEMSGLPVYKVAAMMTHLARLIVSEAHKGGSVTIPRVGEFRGRVRRAKEQKNVIVARVPGGTLRATRNLPARRALVFTPLPGVKWL